MKTTRNIAFEILCSRALYTVNCDYMKQKPNKTCLYMYKLAREMVLRGLY